MRLGLLNRKISFERAADSADGSGATTRTWSSFGEAMAEATPVGSKEALVAGTLRAAQGWRFQMRFREDVTIIDRIDMAGDKFAIQSVVDPDGRRQMLVIFAETAAL